VKLARIVKWTVVLLTITALSRTHVTAQTVGERLVTMKIDFDHQLFWLENADGSVIGFHGHTQGAILREASDVFLPKATVARLIIIRSNPLVYKYASKELELTDTSDFTAASNFAAAVSAIIKLLGAPAPSAAALAAGTPGRSAADVTVDEILRRNGIADVKGVDDFMVTLDEAISTLSVKSEQIPVLFVRAKDEQTEVRRIVCGNASACTWDLESAAKTIEEGFSKVDRIHRELSFDANTRTHAVTLGLSQVLQHRDAVIKALKAAKDFTAAVSRIDQDLVLPNEAAYLLSKNRPIEVTRTELKLGGEPKSDNVKKYTFTFRPDSPVTYGFGADYVYAFVRGSTFSAKKQGEQLVIAETPLSDYVGSKIGAVMSIAPTRWVNTPFTPFAEVGVNVKGLDKIKESAGLLGGVGFSPYGLFTFGFGALFQQVPMLDGQQVGDAVASESDIKTKFRFKRGWYLHLTVTKKLGA
jgi:hypothetical protein